MTVGIVALALERKAIVLMADKMITMAADLGVEQSETKGAFLPNGWIALYAGGTTFAQLVVGHYPPILEKAVADGADPLLPAVVMDSFHRAYADVWDYVVEHEILRPRHFTREEYQSGIADQATREAVEQEREAKERDESPEFLLCGFDAQGFGHIVNVSLRSEELSGAFDAIGSGGPVAHARLVWQKTNENDELARVLYEVYTAKVQAEMNRFVGPGSDAYVMFGNGQDNLRALSDDSKRRLAEVFRFNDRTPFRMARRRSEIGKEPIEPDSDWERAFVDFKVPLPDHLREIRERILRDGAAC